MSNGFKFIQIATTSLVDEWQLFALDSEGGVWKFTEGRLGHQCWVEMTNQRGKFTTKADADKDF